MPRELDRDGIARPPGFGCGVGERWESFTSLPESTSRAYLFCCLRSLLSVDIAASLIVTIKRGRRDDGSLPDRHRNNLYDSGDDHQHAADDIKRAEIRNDARDDGDDAKDHHQI